MLNRDRILVGVLVALMLSIGITEGAQTQYNHEGATFRLRAPMGVNNELESLVNSGELHIHRARKLEWSTSSSYTQMALGRLTIEIGGKAVANDYGRMILASSVGVLNMDGRLELTLAAGYVLARGDSFPIISGAVGRTGQFATLVGTGLPGGLKFDVQYGPGSVTLVVVPGP